MRAYSNPSDQVERLRSLLELPCGARRERCQPPPKQVQKRLDPEQTAQLVDGYQAGAQVKQLARQFGIHRLTATSILQRQGITPRSRSIRPDDLPEVIRLYEEGWALARLAAKFDVSASTVANTLCRAGVPVRQPGRLPTSV